MIKDWELDEWHTIVHENKWKCDELLYITLLKLKGESHMVTLKEISDKLNGDLETAFQPNVYDIDVGDYNFISVKPIDEAMFLYIYETDDPNVKLLFNEDRMAFILYIRDGDKVKATIWRMGTKNNRTIDIDEINPDIFG